MSTETSASSTRRQTAVTRRLAKIREHADFPAAEAYTPPAEEDLDRASKEVRGGLVLLVVGAALVALGAASVFGGVLGIVVGVLALLAGGHFAFHGSRRRAAVLARPLTRICALVADRRSETTPTWLGGRTIYYFTLQLEDGETGEYRYPGRGTQDDLLVKGLTGVAFLRGDTLIAWKNIRV
jgi:hypothetical protein